MTRRGDDDVVEKVRAARQRIVKRCGSDARRMRQWANRLEAGRIGPVVRFESTTKAGRNG